MTTVVVAGPDENGLATALADRGVETVRVEGLLTRERLLEAGLPSADVFVLTNVDEGDATAIPLALEVNPAARVVVYAHDSLPEFARAQADLAVDPDLLAADVVAEELA
jgi:Trk K+ transport system NAD-binding subunit